MILSFRRRRFQFRLATLLFLLAIVPIGIGYLFGGKVERWQGNDAVRTWQLTTTDDRFQLDITRRADGAQEQVIGTIRRVSERRMTFLVEQPGKTFFPYATTDQGDLAGLGYEIFLNWRSQPKRGTEFCFTCCDDGGLDHCIVMHRK